MTTTPSQPSPSSQVAGEPCSDITLTVRQMADLLDDLAVLYGASSVVDRRQTPTLNTFTNTLIHELQQLAGVRKMVGATKEIGPR